ncbi:MAG: twin-arginine translocation signal domain-containing protein [Nitrospinae bacterium]|nr:twin-arginine translocation signal domain-containing protein [Nitrospinota bacterium]
MSNKDEEGKTFGRRDFIKTAAVTTLGAIAGLATEGSSRPALAQTASGGGSLPDSTPITSLLDAANASVLTATAAALTKADLLNLRQADEYKTASLLTGAHMQLTVADLQSIEEAFDMQNGTYPGSSSARMARSGGYDPSVMDTTACCCCSTAPCCCCTAAAQADSARD